MGRVEQNLISANRFRWVWTIAKLGSWKHDLITNDSIWSKAIMKFFELEELPDHSMLLPGQNSSWWSVDTEADKIVMETAGILRCYRIWQ
jgi:hypothetical protein